MEVRFIYEGITICQKFTTAPNIGDTCMIDDDRYDVIAREFYYYTGFTNDKVFILLGNKR